MCVTADSAIIMPQSLHATCTYSRSLIQRIEKLEKEFDKNAGSQSRIETEENDKFRQNVTARYYTGYKI